MDLSLWIYKLNQVHREKDRFTKYGGVFILAHDSFNLTYRSIFIVSQSEVIHTAYAYVSFCKHRHLHTTYKL